MIHLKKTPALKAAAKSVSSITRYSSTDYVMFVDHDVTNPRGPCVEVRASSYPQAVLKRSSLLAVCALQWMGKLDDESQYAVYAQAHDRSGARTARAMLEAGLAKFGTGPTAAQLAKAGEDYWHAEGVKAGAIES